MVPLIGAIRGARSSSRDYFMSDVMQTLQVVEQRGQLIEPVGVRAVTQRAIGILMHFHEDAIDAGGDRRTRYRRDELALTARSIASAARKLRRMGRIENDGIAEASHDDQRAHVGDEIVVAE